MSTVSILTRIIRQAKLKPNKVAIEENEQSCTFSELVMIFTTRAGSLRRIIGSKAVVGLVFQPGMQGLITCLAALKAGYTVVPIDSTTAENQINYIVQEAQLDLIISSHRVTNFLKNLSIPVLYIGELTCDPILEFDTDNEDAFIFFTSGSLGQPKGVKISHQSINLMYESWQNECNLQGKCKKYLNSLGYGFSLFFDDSFLALCSGATIVFSSQSIKIDTEEYCLLINHKRIDYLDLVPSVARQLMNVVEKNNLSLPSLRFIVVGSEGWYVHEFLRLKKLFPSAEVISSYGLTESEVDAGIFRGNEKIADSLSENSLVPIGKPFGTSRFLILDDENREVRTGKIGELCLGGPGLANGYVSKNKDRGVFFTYKGERMLRTGDFVSQDKNGLYFLHGRKDRLIKLRGRRIDMEELEGFIRGCEGVEDCSIVPLQKGQSIILVCFIVSQQKLQLIQSQIIERAKKEEIDITILPNKYYLCSQIPYLSNGKTDFKTLKSMVSSDLDNLLSGGSKHDDQENANFIKIAVKVFSEVSGKKIKPNDNFFELGIDSLSIAQIGRMLRKRGIEVSFDNFYIHQTINELFSNLGKKSGNQRVQKDYLADLLWKGNKKLTIFPLLSRKRRALLTGSTGYVGIYFLKELLHRFDEVICLIRAKDKNEAMQKLSIAWFSVFQASMPQEGIRIVMGDFSKTSLGLEKEEYDWLSKNVTTTFHIGYWVNFTLSYDLLRQSNVVGADEIITFCLTGKRKDLIFLSSSSTVLLDHFPERRQRAGGYELSKWVTEQKIQNASRTTGLKSTIYAAGLISPNRMNNHYNQKDFFLRFLTTCLTIKLFPDIDWSIDLVPVDDFPILIINDQSTTSYVSCKKKLLTNKQIMNWTEVLRVLRINQEISVVSFGEWKKVVQNNIDFNIILPIIPFWDWLKKESEENIFDTYGNVFSVEKVGKIIYNQISTQDILMNIVNRNYSFEPSYEGLED